MNARQQPHALDLEQRIRAKGDEAFSLATAGRMTEARASYAELADLVAQRPQQSVQRMELALGLA